ncbi:molecular chaperone DnaJ [Corynebacterium sp. zg254]|uniref:Chaperone protein DnaJ n=1 Tax=Corynebacterium zhongnanshanii TaxID=2768834 RepID=A0ABQ6VCN0_9CORY|nr:MULTISPECIES: molecular chaperone DnaJ [Corynebacterium]KAB3519934.1 molecular chaperone DnaJ [Corynebacterium zhongnanshanii]MCR5914882.1 molecular chaperone DnaJ [Corynebacterium sp. zg254]
MAQREWADKDYYRDLGVNSKASAEEIKKAYRKIAREDHPDKKPGDKAAEERFKKASEAYSVVGDKDKRAEYDEFKRMVASGGFNGFSNFTSSGRSSAGFDPSDVFGRAASTGGFGDIFSNLFGDDGRASAAAGAGARGGQRRTDNGRGADVETEITLEFREATKGVTVPIRLTKPDPCGTCHGSGAKAGTTPKTCGTCHGSGMVSENRGAFGFSRPCADCGGAGSIIDEQCPDCSGTGRVTQARTITVRVPAGVVDGQKVRLAGQGSAGERGKPSGDLFVTVHVKKDKVFSRNGDDLLLNVPVSFHELVLGGTVTVPTLGNKVRLRIPQGTADGTTLRIRGHGVHKRNGASGDLLVTVHVTVPKDLDEGAMSALRKYSEEEKRSGFDPREGWEGNS